MGCNKVSNDADHVVQDPKPTKTPKEAPPQPCEMPAFTPMHIENPLIYGEPTGFDFFASSIDVFNCFFTDAILQTLVDNTNAYVAAPAASKKPHAREWSPTTVPELRAYIGAYIWMGVYNENDTEDY